MRPSTRRSAAIALIALGIYCVTAETASAGCTTVAERAQVARALRYAIQCNYMKLRNPAANCPAAEAPACSGTLVRDAAALAYGSNNPTVEAAHLRLQGEQLSCQRRIGLAVSSYVRLYLAGLVGGVDEEQADARARQRLERLPQQCTVAVRRRGNLFLPQVGAQCAAAAPLDGSVDGTSLASCLHTLLKVWVDRNGPRPTPLRPNIVVILADDQRWDATDATHGIDGKPVMPRVRGELADSGVEFTNAFVTTPLCCPSRSSILNGEYAYRHGVYKNSGVNGGADDFDDVDTLARWLHASGYRTALVGKYLNNYDTLWAPRDRPYVPPFWDEWHAFTTTSYYDYRLVRNGGGYDHDFHAFGSTPGDYSTDVLRAIAVDFVRTSVEQGRPFFLYFTPFAPHLPKQPAPRHKGSYAGAVPWRPPSYNELDVSDKPYWQRQVPRLTAALRDEIDQIRISQLEQLQALDEAVGGNAEAGIAGIVPTLRDLGVLDDTLVIYASDNGFLWGEHRVQRKTRPYEEALRIPLILHYPKLAPLPRRESRIALNIDFCSTALDLAGASATIHQDGTSLVPLIDSTATTWRTDFLTEAWPVGREWATVHGERWKYTELPTDPGNPATSFEKELYDLENDPYELENLATDPMYATRMDNLAARLRELRPNWPIDADGGGPDPAEED